MTKVDWDKLVEDLKIGKELAELAAQGEDGGSANLDTVYIRLPRQRESKVMKAFEKAGLRAMKRNYLGSVIYIIDGIRCGIGNSNYRATQAMYKYLKEQGWDVSVLYTVD